MKPLHITHIDRGVEPVSKEDITGQAFVDPETGRWPKVSFSDGMTVSYAFITNTKIVFLTGRNEEVFTDPDYSDLVNEFMDSDREFNESNWRTQRQRVSNWKPEYIQEREVA